MAAGNDEAEMDVDAYYDAGVGFRNSQAAFSWSCHHFAPPTNTYSRFLPSISMPVISQFFVQDGEPNLCII